jgi:hypothetical protein
MFYIVLAQTNKQNKIRETAMRKNTNQTMLFKEISGKKVQVDFNGGEVSSDAGLLFLRETESRIGIINKIVNVFDDKRHPSYIRHKIFQLLTQRVFQIAAGYEDANDSNDLRNDPILKISCENDNNLASQPTISRFENTATRSSLYRIAQGLVDIFIDSYDRPPKGIILDIDDTDDPTHGHQQLSLFNAYHDCYCYMPLHIYEGKSGKLIATILRPGKRPSGKETVSILKRIIKQIRDAWPQVGILIRGDSHYSSTQLYDFCREHNLSYVLGIKSYKPLAKRTWNLTNKAKELYELRKMPIKIYGEFSYKAGSWSVPNRIIFKAEHNREGSNTRFIVTNLAHTNRRFIYETAFCGRGAMEGMIKEHKNHLASDRTSCHSFQANQFRLFMHSIAYTLIHAFREKHLKNTEFAKAQFSTIRLKLLKIGARVRQLSTKIKIHLPSSYPLKEDFRKIWLSCCSAGFS